MSKILNLLGMIIVGFLVLTSTPLVITYFAEIERQHEFMVALILFILAAIPITLREKLQKNDN